MNPKLKQLVQEAKRNGEYVPTGVYLIGDREPTTSERNFGLALEAKAKEVQERKDR